MSELSTALTTEFSMESRTINFFQAVETGSPVLQLTWNGGVLDIKYEVEATAAAKMFFDVILKEYADAYVAKRIAEAGA